MRFKRNFCICMPCTRCNLEKCFVWIFPLKAPKLKNLQSYKIQSFYETYGSLYFMNEWNYKRSTTFHLWLIHLHTLYIYIASVTNCKKKKIYSLGVYSDAPHLNYHLETAESCLDFEEFDAWRIKTMPGSSFYNGKSYLHSNRQHLLQVLLD